MASKGKITEIADIQAIQKQIDTINSGLGTVVKSLETVTANSLKVNESFSNSKGLKDLTEAQKNLSKEQREAEIHAQKLAREAANREKAELNLANAIEKQNKQSKEQTSAYKNLSDELNKNRKAWKDLAAVNQQNSIDGQKLLKTIQEQDKKLKEIDATVGQHQRNVGNYGDAIKGVGTKIIGLVGALGLGMSAVEVFNRIIDSTNATSDKFNEMLSGAKEATNTFFRAVASGDWSNLIGKMQEAYSVGVEYEKQLDRLKDRQVSQNAELANIDNLIAKQTLIAKTASNSLDVRKKALAEIKKLEEQRLVIVQDEAKLALDAETERASKLTGLNKKQIEDLVINYKKYESIIESAGNTFKKLEEQSKRYITDRRTGIMTEIVDNTKLNKLISEQSESVQKNIKAWQATEIIFGNNAEMATKISEGIVNLKQADTDYTENKIKLIRTENKITNESQNLKVKSISDANKVIADLDLEKLDDEIDYNKIGLAAIEAKNKATEDSYNEVRDLVIQSSNEKTEAELANIDKTIEAEKAAAEKRKEIYQASSQAVIDIFNGIVGLQNAAYESDLQKLDDKAKQDEEAKEKELKAAGNNAELKEKINKKYEAKEKEREKERRKIEIEKAKFQKQAAIFGIILDTAKKIIEVFPNPILMAAAGITGAAQLAVAAAQPIPKYKHGRKGGKAELAIVGEAGQEAIRLKSGETYLTPNKETRMFLPDGASVIPNHELMKNLSYKELPANIRNEKHSFSELIPFLSNISDTIKGKKETHLNITESGFYTIVKNGSSQTTYVNNKFKS